MSSHARSSAPPALCRLDAGPVGLVRRVRVPERLDRQREAVVLAEGRERSRGDGGQLGQRRAAVVRLPPGGLHQVRVLLVALGHVASVSRCTARCTSRSLSPTPYPARTHSPLWPVVSG